MSAIDREASGSETRSNQAEMGLGQSAWPVPGPVRAPFDLRAPLYIVSASAGRHIHPFIREPLT
jgi:hypothetical protein